MLLIESSEEDARLLLDELARHGYEIDHERVEDAEGTTTALEEGGWDVVISDHYLPGGYGALKALRLVKEKGPDLPFVIVSNRVGEENAVEAIKAGADGYVMKDGLARLCPVIEQELGNAEVRRARRRAEEALTGGEERFRATFGQAAVGVVHAGLDGRWLRVNKKLCDIVGRAEEELLGFDHRSIVHPDDLEADLDLQRSLLAGETETYLTEKRYFRADGSLIWVSLTVSLVRDDVPGGEPRYIIAVIEDITRRKLAEEALRQSEERYRAVVEQSAEAIFLVDADTACVVEANPAFQKLLGYTANELKATRLQDLVARDPSGIEQDGRIPPETVALVTGEQRYRCKDGRLLDVEAKASMLSYGGRDALCIVAHDVTDRKWTEDSLRHNLDVLLALREAGQILSSSLELEKVATKLLDIMRSVSGLVAAVISVQDEYGRFQIWRASGLDGLPPQVRYASEAEEARHAVLETGQARSIRLPRSGSGTGRLTSICLPLRLDNSVTGVLEAYGSEDMADEDDVAEVLGSLALQAASALENARLYGELAERERQLENLVGKLITAQEEERRHVAHEVHDGLAQLAVAAHQRLQAFAQRYPSAPKDNGAKDLDRILALMRRTVSEARRVIANLRPTALDDFGLAAAIRLEVEELRGNGWSIDFDSDLREERLPTVVETALFRIAQEALTNVRKHARADRARLILRRVGGEIVLEIRDWGQGFDPNLMDNVVNGPGERVGLSGMRERIAMIGGHLEVHSKPGKGTIVMALVPLPRHPPDLGGNEDGRRRTENQERKPAWLS